MKETCEFEKWLEQIEEKIKELPVEEKLEIIAEEIYSRYDARVWFSEISGKRWSYIAGWGGYDPTPVHPDFDSCNLKTLIYQGKKSLSLRYS